MPSPVVYLPEQRSLPVSSIKKAERPSAIPYFEEVSAPLRSALTFCWEWLQGQEQFTQATSGSTGTPQVITLSRGQMMASARLTIEALQLTAQHTALVCLNTDYIGGKMMLVRSLMLEMDMILVPPASYPLSDLPVLPTFTALVPLQVQTILKQDPAALNHFQGILVGGAPVSPALEARIQQNVRAPIYATYGMTETVSHIALRSLNTSPPAQVYTVLGDTHIDADTRGCLTIRGAVTNHQKIVTNDLVDIIDARSFRWIGRHDFVINSGGVKVSPEQVEATLGPILRSLKVNSRFLVTALPDERLGEKVVLVIESDDLTNEAKQALLIALKETLSPYEAPREVHALPQFIETPSGKINRLATKHLLFANP